MVTGQERLKFYYEAEALIPSGIPVNILLYPMEGDYNAAIVYWLLAYRTRRLVHEHQQGLAVRKRRDVEVFSLSFLDCICCGFGAIILLLVLSKVDQPVILEKTEDDLQQLIAQLQEELFELQGETTVVTRALSAVRLETSETRMTLAQLQKELNKVQGQYELTLQDATLTIDEGELRSARQRLTEEMARLQVYNRAPDEAIGGIPVDSEYVIFVIDTSGSMQAKWSFLEQKFREVLDAYPRVRGLQIMNDNGQYMFPQQGGTWMDDTPQLRQAVRNTIRTWAPFSDSDPSDGIIYALQDVSRSEQEGQHLCIWRRFHRPVGAAVVNEVDALNPENAAGERTVRIHALGFPTNFTSSSSPTMAQKYAGLMRVICERNGGTLVGLTERN